MASIERRDHGGHSTFRVVWREHGQKQYETFPDHDSAVRFRGLVDAAGQRWPDGWVPHEGWEEPVQIGTTLDEWAPRAIGLRTGANARTRHDYLRDYTKHVSPVLGSTQLSELDSEKCAEWLLGMKGSDKTVRNVRGMLSGVLDAAVPKHLSSNPLRGLERALTDVPSEMVFLSEEEFGRVYGAMNELYKDFIALKVTTGLRFSEITALTYNDFDLDNGRLNVSRAWKRGADNKTSLGPPKSIASIRSIDLDDDQIALVSRDGHPNGLVFTTRDGNRIRHSNFYNRYWRPAVENAQLPRRPRIHDLRHTHAAWLIKAKIPLPVIQKRLGHESITTTIGKYGHLDPTLQAEVKAATTDFFKRLKGT